MDFDEYEYLEKTVVEETEQRDPLSSKKSKDKDKDTGFDKNDKEHRKDKKSRSEDDRVGRRDRDVKERSEKYEKDRRRSSRNDDREVDREKDRKRTSRYLDKDTEGEIKEKDRSRKHETDRDRERECEFDVRDNNRRFKEKKEKVEPEHDPERDQRTVFAFQMPLKATEKDAYDFFSKAGKVRDVRIIMDRNSRRSKGVGYIEFYDAMSVPMAIALTGQLLLGQPVIVKPSEAEKNLVQSTTSIAGSAAGPYGVVDRKLYVGNLHFNMTELQLKQIFESFGQIELVQLPTDPETGHCKGFGFIQFAKLEDAKNAEKLNGQLDIAGRIIKVSSVADHVGLHDSGAKAADFDDDDGVGMALNAQSRAMLMQKLDRSGTATSFAQSFSDMTSSQQTAIPSPILPSLLTSVETELIGKPSECLLLKNLFDPSTETVEDFDIEIKEEVEEECSKYGRVNHSYVEKNSSGYVYMRFDTMEEAAKAQAAMHKRWFACRLISAVFLQTYEYDAKFKRST